MQDQTKWYMTNKSGERRLILRNETIRYPKSTLNDNVLADPRTLSVAIDADSLSFSIGPPTVSLSSLNLTL